MLIARGDRVTVLSRDVHKAQRRLPSGVRVAAWQPPGTGPWIDELDRVDAVAHLAGEAVAQRWTEAKKREIVDSRVGSTEALVNAIERASHKPKVLVSGSATGFYGPRPDDETCDEATDRGSGFLADLVEKWEGAAMKAEALGVRTVLLRTGVVFGKGGGALERMVPAFKMFAGGPVGDGKQIYSWVHIDDVVGMILFAIDDDRVKGPMNATSPFAATAKEVANALGTVLNRPAWLRVPKGMVGLFLGEAAEILTESQKVFPKKAVELGYEFQHAKLVPALESLLGE